MDLILLNLRPECEPEAHAETEVDAPLDQANGNSSAGAVTEGILEIFNPFEALVEEPRAAVILLVFFVVVILGVIVLNGMWSVIQEALSGGGPPQGLGLR